MKQKTEVELFNSHVHTMSTTLCLCRQQESCLLVNTHIRMNVYRMLLCSQFVHTLLFANTASSHTHIGRVFNML